MPETDFGHSYGFGRTCHQRLNTRVRGQIAADLFDDLDGVDEDSVDPIIASRENVGAVLVDLNADIDEQVFIGQTALAQGL